MIQALSPAARTVPGVARWAIPSREKWLINRQKFIGASEIAALFGCHPYQTAAELFAIKTGAYKPHFAEAVVEDDAIILPPTERGLLFEGPALSLVARINPTWRVEPNSVPGGHMFADATYGLSSTPDAFLYAPAQSGPGCLQIKSVAEPVYKSKWFEDGARRLPLAHAIQLTIDAALSGCTWGYVGVFVVGFSVEFRMFRVEIRPGILDRARELARDFWRRVAAHEPYPFDFARDGDLIDRLYGDDDGSTIDLGEDPAVIALLNARALLRHEIKAGEDAVARRKTLDKEIIVRLGNASVARLDDGRMITAKTTNRAGYAVNPTSFRSVRVLEPKASPARAAKEALSETLPDRF